MGEQKKCVFLAYADHPHSGNPKDKRSQRDDEFFQSLIAEVREAGLVVYHRENYRGQADSRIVESVRESLSKCNNLVALVARHSLSVGWEMGEARRIHPDTRILCLAPVDRYITRTCTGLVELGEVILQRYEKEKDIATIIVAFVNGTK